MPKLANPKYANSWVLDCLIDTDTTDSQIMYHDVRFTLLYLSLVINGAAIVCVGESKIRW